MCGVVGVFRSLRGVASPTWSVLIGRSYQSRVLFVVHAQRGERVRLIRARKASPVQRKKYEQGI